MISKRVMDLLKQIASELLTNSKEVSKLDETTIIYYLDNYMYGQG